MSMTLLLVYLLFPTVEWDWCPDRLLEMLTPGNGILEALSLRLFKPF
jgi:hypothetical protein